MSVRARLGLLVVIGTSMGIVAYVLSVLLADPSAKDAVDTCVQIGTEFYC